MPLYLQILFYLTKTVFSLYVLSSTLNIFFYTNTSMTFLKRISIYLIYILIGTQTNFLKSDIWINMIIQVILVAIVSVNFKGSIKSKAVMSFSWTAFVTITEIVVSASYVVISKTPLDAVLANDSSRLIASAIHILLILIVIKFAEMTIKKRRLTEDFSYIDSLRVGAIPIFSVILLYFLIEISLNHSIPLSTIIVFCIIIVLTNIFFFILFDNLKKAEQLKYENALLKNQAEYFSRLEENANNTFEKVRTIKHDLKYQLLCLKAKSEEKSTNSLEDIGNLLENMIEDTLSEKQIEYTKNKRLNRLLNYKLFAGSENGIEFDIKVSIREDIYIDEVSLYIILGNAIDNATCNFDSSNSSMKNILIRIIDDCENLFIKIANPYNKRLKFKNGLPLTDKPNKELHGIGLQSIKNLVERKNGHFKLTNVDNIFTLEVLLYDEIKYENSDQD